MNAALRKALIALAATPLIAAAFLALTAAVFAIPNERIIRNLNDRPEALLARRADNGRVIDADTECIGMSVGLDLEPPRGPLLERAVNAQSLYGCDALMRWIGGSPEEVRDYFRYWHGYLAIARPLLAIMTYNDLRGFLFLASAGLFLRLLWRLGADFGPKTALAVAAPFVVINAMGFFVVATKAVTWLLAIGGALALSRRRNGETPLLFFFLLGALSAYFDFFTAPAFVFSFAALIGAIYGRMPTWKPFLLCGFFFGAGWAGFILLKVVIAAAVLEENVWRDFIDTALFRVRGASEHIDSLIPGMALYQNFAAMKSFWAPVAIICFIVLPFATKARRARWAALLRERTLLLAIAAAPLVWLELFTNHSQIHAAFTQINYAPAFVLAALVIVGSPALARRAA